MSLPSELHAIHLGGAQQYQVARSLRIRSTNNAYLSRTPASSGSLQKMSFSYWVKRGHLAVADSLADFLYAANCTGGNYFYMGFDSADRLFIAESISGSWQYNLTTNAVYRDLSSWYHVVMVIDTTQATASNRVLIYVNGTQVTSFSTASYPPLNYSHSYLNAASIIQIMGWQGQLAPIYYGANFYLAEVNFIDGQQLTPSSFGTTDSVTGAWIPTKYTGTYGTNGFYLPFSDNSGATATTIGADKSGNGNNWTPSGISVTSGTTNDSMVDSPTNYGIDAGNGGEVRGNYCTIPAFDNAGQTWTVSEGNLRLVNGNYGAYTYTVRGTLGVNTGKWYFETYINSIGSDNEGGVGIIDTSWQTGTTSYQPNATVFYFRGNGNIYQGVNGSGTLTTLQSTGTTCTTADTIGVAFDVDNKIISFYKNGTIMGSSQAFTLTTGNYVAPSHRGYYNTDFTFNFGQRPFTYTAPSGFKALCTQNLSTPTIS